MDLETWRWIWLVATAVFAIGEIAVAGSFFLAPFAVGAALAAALAFAGAALWVQWAAFVIASVVAFAAMRPLARKVDNMAPAPAGVGANRLVGLTGTVLDPIPGGNDLGRVLVDREEWRAESFDGSPVPAGFAVQVVDVRGTRVVVGPVSPP